MTREETKTFMSKLKEAYGERFLKQGVTSDVVTMWAVALGDISLATGLQTIGLHMKQCKFPPEPCEIIALAEEIRPARLGLRPCPSLDKFKAPPSREVNRLEA